MKLKLIWSVFLICSSLAAGKKTKRMIGGRGPLHDHDLYNTHYMVSLLETWKCVSDQTNHQFTDCQHTHVCTGSLIRPDFILTACHCIAYEDYYTDIYETWIPPIVSSLWTYHDFATYLEDRINYGTVKRLGTYKIKASAKHAVLNAMTIMAGDTHLYGKQRRHAAKFYPHHLCTERHSRKNPEGFMTPYENFENEMDIGLVKACKEFVINKDVKLAPIQPYDKIERHLRKLLLENAVCLVAGWGFMLDPSITLNSDRSNLKTVRAHVAQHDFRYIDCTQECGKPWENCRICDRPHGPNMSTAGGGDSGCPLVCDGFVTGVLTASEDLTVYNSTGNLHVAVACVKEFITNRYIAYLRSTANEQFHYINGKPVRAVAENYPEDLNPIIFPDIK